MMAYFKTRLSAYLLFFLSLGLFAVAFSLYHLPLGAVAYPGILCLCLLLGAEAVRFVRYWQKHRRLQKLVSLPDNLGEVLEHWDSPEDRDYRAIVEAILEEKNRLQEENATAVSDMTDYFTTWAHQIKTPIAAMGLKLQNEDSPFSRELTQSLFDISQYVEMVLCYLRLGSETTDYVLKAYDLDTIVKGALRKYADQFICRGLTLRFEETGKRVLTDSKWLSFVIEQVLSNAVKYTPAGTVTVCLQGEELCIRDTGIGIDPMDLPRIFEKGYTGLSGRVDRSATGLGLYLCKRICGKLGHSIRVQSYVGKGTAIFIGLNRPDMVLE